MVSLRELFETIETCEAAQHDCYYMYDCCDCGGNDCGCPYCWSCNACDNCKEGNGRKCELLEDAPFPTAHSASTYENTADDIGEKFIQKLSERDTIVQAEVLRSLFGQNWEHPHTEAEIAASYVGATTKHRAYIDKLISDV
jgi:hypothetical protein